MSEKAETGRKIQELQLLEQNAQNLLLQKQTFQVEMNELQNAIAELNHSSNEVYKILGGIMVRSTKDILVKELTEKKKVLELRIQAIEKQEKIVDDKSRKIRIDVTEAVQDKKSK